MHIREFRRLSRTLDVVIESGFLRGFGARMKSSGWSNTCLLGNKIATVLSRPRQPHCRRSLATPRRWSTSINGASIPKLVVGCSHISRRSILAFLVEFIARRQPGWSSSTVTVSYERVVIVRRVQDVPQLWLHNRSASEQTAVTGSAWATVLPGPLANKVGRTSVAYSPC